MYRKMLAASEGVHLFYVKTPVEFDVLDRDRFGGYIHASAALSQLACDRRNEEFALAEVNRSPPPALGVTVVVLLSLHVSAR